MYLITYITYITAKIGLYGVNLEITTFYLIIFR